ncbi:MAG TPA: hypothetical protein VJ824_08190 [Bacillota bacterium]|nr:hypothetical protein [Bacillota bacterium]
MNKKQVRAYLSANPDFSTWVKAKPELVQKIKDNPNAVTELFDTWKKGQIRKEGIKKIADHYRGIVDQVQELHTLLQRVDHIVNNVKTMAQTVEGINTQKLEPTPIGSKQGKSKQKK